MGEVLGLILSLILVTAALCCYYMTACGWGLGGNDDE